MAKQDVELQFRLIDGVTKSLTQIQKGVTGLGASISSVNQAAELTSKAFGAIAGAASAIGGAVSSAASVEDALVRVSDITKATTEEQAALQQAIRDAVDSTRFSAEEAAGALVLLSEDGFSASQAVDELGRVLAFAQANALSAAEAANGLGGVLDTYSEKPQIIGELADKLTAVSRAAGVSTKALQDGLVAIGVTAEQANIPLDDAIGYLGLLASNGLEGSKGVKSLTTVLRDIQDPASKAGKALNELGLEGADFGDILARVGGDSAAAEKLLLAFTGKSRDALKALLAQGGGDLGKFAEVIKNAGGESKRASDILNKTFNGALERITNQLALTRNELLTPILGPLSEELQSLSTRLSEFAQTPEFDEIVNRFSELSAEAARYIGELIESFDFTKAVDATVDFSAQVVDNLGRIKSALDAVLNSVDIFAASIRVAFNAAIVAVAGSLGSLAGAVAGFSEEADALALSLADIAEEARNDTGKAMADLSVAVDKAGKSANKAASGVETLKKQSIAVVAPLDAFGGSLDDIGIGLGVVAEQSDRASENTARLGEKSEEAALGLERLALARAADALAKLGANANQSSAEFQRLKKEVADSEERIRRLTESGDRNKDSVDKQTEAVKRLKQELRDLGNEQDDVNSGNERLSEGNSQVSESFGSITISLGNLSGAFVRTALEAAGAAGTIRGYIDTLNDYFAEGARQEEAILRAIDVIDRQNAALSDEDRIRRQLIQQYGESSTLIEVLLKKKLELLRANKANNDESQREIDLEKEKNAGIAGGLGTGNQAQQSSAATGNRNGGGSAANRGESAPISITINQNGATPETIRELTPLIERELIRLGALRR